MKLGFLLLNLLLSTMVFAADTTIPLNLKQDVHLYLNTLKDSSISKSPFIEAGMNYADFDHSSAFSLGARAGFPLDDRLEILADMNFVKRDPDGNAKSQSGLTDLTMVGKYLLIPGPTQVSVGGLFTLPIGEDDLGQGNFNFGGFASLRHPVSEIVLLTGGVGLDIIELHTGAISTDRKASLNLNGGAIIALNEQIHVITEAEIRTKTDEFMLTAAVDMALEKKVRLRGGIGLGVDDASPDFTLAGSFLINF